MTKKILFFAGSLRKDSFNKKLAKNAQKIANDLGVETTFIDLDDYKMPLYNGDLEENSGIPVNAKKIKDMMIANDALFITSPEYNSSFSGVLKNTIDWVSRPHKHDEVSLQAFDNKVAAIASASPGALGGLRGLVPLRIMLSNIKVTVISNQYALAKANEAFDENGDIKNPQQKEALENVVKKLIEFTRER